MRINHSQKVQLMGPIFETEWSKGSNCVSVPNFVAIGPTVAEMEIFRFFKMADAAILDFSNLKFLTVGRLKSAELRHLAKLGQNRSNGSRDNDDFSILQDSGRCHVGFLNY